ncbi:MAG: carboxypeptidase M32 [Armatimonadota bacterium]
MEISSKLKFFYERLSELYKLNCIASLLDWDMQVYMPEKGASFRAEQLEFIELLAHQKLTDSVFYNTIRDLYENMDNLSDDDRVNVREIFRVVERKKKLPDEFVSEKTKACSNAYNVWVKARPENSYEEVKPYLKHIFELARKECDLVGYEKNKYDALLDTYEPYGKIEEIKPLLLELADGLKSIIKTGYEKTKDIKDINVIFSADKQFEMCSKIAEDLGYSFSTGRIDKTAHPFMTTIGPQDQRITTRFYENNILLGLYSTIHETGHALYELGLPVDRAGTPLGSSVSMGIHESQSRLWENIVGRSREFAEYLHKVMIDYFPGEMKDISVDDLFANINKIKPSLIRVESDEVTYSQHIVIRMLLEEKVLENEVDVDDLPEAWNAMYEEYLGIKPDDYKDGVMQDVHWFTGAIGYFPTYALGNLYNAMMFKSAKVDIPDISDNIKNGQFEPLLLWLRDKVHKHGMRYTGPELIQKITGNKLSAKPFLDYLNNKIFTL